MKRCWSVFCDEGKSESGFVHEMMERLFDGKDASIFEAIACVGINPGRRSERETDVTLLLSWGEREEAYKVSGTDQISKRITSEENIILRQGDTVWLNSAAINIEIKGHGASGIQISGESLCVMYPNNQIENVTAKLTGQAKSTRKFLKEQLNIDFSNVVSLIYLPSIVKSNVTDKQKSEGISTDDTYVSRSIIFQDTNYSAFMSLIINAQGVYGRRNDDSYLGTNRHNTLANPAIRSRIESYSRQLVPTKLEQDKLEKISAHYIDKNRKLWVDELGKSAIAFRGRAGTGKTLRLLKTAHYLITECMDAVLLLTFNRPLARDLQRLMCFHSFHTGSAPAIKTIDTFLYELANVINLVDKVRQSGREYYQEIRELLVMAIEDPDLLLKMQSYAKQYTIVAIDEAQDWFDSERALILALFKPQQILIADGDDQILRAPERANWKADILNYPGLLKVVPNTMAIRQEKNLSIFTNSLAKKLCLNWFVSPCPDALGGEVCLFHILTKEVFNNLIQEHLNCGATDTPDYAPIDYLALTGRRSFDARDMLFKGLARMKYEYWDAISEDDRDKMPERNQIRCVSYESCRGLEAWAALLLDIDAWHEFCVTRQKQFVNDLSITLPTWFLIPFTRAKSRILLQIPENDEIKRVLLEIATENPSFVTIMN